MVTLTINEMPSHDHTQIVSRDVSPGSGLKTPWSDGTGSNTRNTGTRGGGQPHENMPPFQVTNFIVKT